MSKMVTADLPKGSCLKIGLIPSLNCTSEESCPGTSILSIRNITIDSAVYEEDNFVTYKMKLVDVMPGKYKMAALMQLGHCDADLSAFKLLKGGCVTTDHPVKVSQFDTSLRSNMKANFEEKLAGTISGKIKLRPALKEIPDGSCLVLSIYEDVKCHGIGDCGPVRRIVHKSLSLVDSNIRYTASLNTPLDSVSYIVDATVNLGWCPEDSQTKQLIRVGDYSSSGRNRIWVVRNTDQNITLDLFADLNTKPERGRGMSTHMLPEVLLLVVLWLSGLTDSSYSTVSSYSCEDNFSQLNP